MMNFDQTNEATNVQLGFHGDAHLLQLIDSIAQNCKVFIETGANIGRSLVYLAKTYPHLNCLSCEPRIEAYEQAQINSKELATVELLNCGSIGLLQYIENHRKSIYKEHTLFWLDAHGFGFQWPLKEEVAYTTTNFKNGYILIDDCKVPGNDLFEYDIYENQICSYDYIKKDIQVETYVVYFPKYSDLTPTHYHPLRGWCLIVFGDEAIAFIKNQQMAFMQKYNEKAD